MAGKETKQLWVLASAEESGIQDFFRDLSPYYNQAVQSETVFSLTVSPWGAAAIETARQAISQNRPFAVALIHFPGGNMADAVETAEGIRKVDPCMNFVILSDSADNFEEIRRRILPAGKLLFVQKPFHPEEILQFTVVMGAMWQSEKELQRVNREMLDAGRELMETNDALSVLARNLEKSRRESETRMIQRIRTLIMPVIQKLQYEKESKRFKPDLDLLSAYIESLTSELAADLKMAAILSRTELQVASLIKNGMTSEEIATHLNISLFTVKTHRKNIRRKLDIQNSGVNLQSYLESSLNGTIYGDQGRS